MIGERELIRHRTAHCSIIVRILSKEKEA